MDVASSEGLVAVHAVVNEERVYMLINQLKRAGSKRYPRDGHSTDDPLIKMKIFPAVDILGGRCVQLVQGNGRARQRTGPALLCHALARWGATALHVVTLMGIGTSSGNAALITDLIRKTGVEIELGGGIRSLEDARHWLETGVDRVIISTLATQDPECIRTLAREFGSKRVMPVWMHGGTDCRAWLAGYRPATTTGSNAVESGVSAGSN